MTPAELRAFLDEQKTMQCATNGPRDLPHLVPLWYYVDGDDLCGWTFAKSQKARNLERDPRATLGVEDGVQYDGLRGVMLECDVVVHRDITEIVRLGAEIMLRNAVPRGETPLEELPEQSRDVIAAQAGKRVGLEFVERRRVSWDHRKLGGVY